MERRRFLRRRAAGERVWGARASRLQRWLAGELAESEQDSGIERLAVVGAADRGLRWSLVHLRLAAGGPETERRRGRLDRRGRISDTCCGGRRREASTDRSSARVSRRRSTPSSRTGDPFPVLSAEQFLQQATCRESPERKQGECFRDLCSVSVDG